MEFKVLIQTCKNIEDADMQAAMGVLQNENLVSTNHHKYHEQ